MVAVCYAEKICAKDKFCQHREPPQNEELEKLVFLFVEDFVTVELTA